MTDIEQKVIAMDIWHLELPVVSRRDHGVGSVESFCEVIIVRLQSEDGSYGFGEASPWSVFTGSPEASFAALNRYLRPLVVGSSLAHRVATMEAAGRAIAHCTEAKAALETALLDLTGQITGVPIHALLGGRCRDAINLSCSLANPNFDEDVALLHRLRADGIRTVKLKAGVADHAFDVQRLEVLATDFPEFDVRVDFNQGLEIDEAVHRVAEVAKFKPSFIEQPVRAHHYDLMARLREQIDVPLLADESVFGPEDMARAIRERICDGVSIKIMKAGGLSRAQAVAKMAGAHGLTAYGGDMFEAGIAHLAGSHMIAATAEITLGCEFYQAQYYLKQDILSSRFPIHNGQVRIPDGPGLGIEPDIDRINHYAVRFSGGDGRR